MPSSLRLATVLVASLLASGCARLSPAPPVDVLPTTPPALSTTQRAPAAATGSLYSQASYRPMLRTGAPAWWATW